VQTIGESRKTVSGAAAQASAPTTVAFSKADEELQVVWGEVYAPNIPDSQGDFMTVEDVRIMMWRFMKADRLKKLDTQHSQMDNGCHIIECFQARDTDSDFIPGSWVIGVWCPDDVWRLVKSGELNGFSLDGIGVRIETALEMDIPDSMEGDTTEVAGHAHRFVVKFDADGGYLGGYTLPGGTDGHVHRIIKGAATEKTGDHSHRFSFVEGIING